MKVSKLKVNLAYSTKVTIRTINGSVIASDVYIHDTKEYDNLIIKFIEVHNRVLVIYVWEGN